MPDISTPDQWTRARLSLLVKEKAFARAREDLAAERRAQPWTPVTKAYVFETADGPRSLSDLFGGNSQLVVYHFMFTPEAKQACSICSFWADTFANTSAHLQARDVAFVAVSRASLDKLEAFKTRQGWTFSWVSSGGCDFNYDFGVSFTKAQMASGQALYNYGSSRPRGESPGLSVFAKDASGAVFHTYSTYGRGLDPMNSAYQILDLTPKGRDEAGLPSSMAWLRRHDQY